jgi:hypothetical protein
MSGSILSIVALLSMMLHSIVGCCWHHGHLSGRHSEPETTVQSSAGVTSATRTGCCSHRPLQHEVAQATSDLTYETSDGNGPCPDSRCAEVATSLTLGPQAVQLVNGVAVSVAMIDVRELPGSAPLVRSSLRVPRVLKVGLEHRAITQVWLI